MKTYEIDLEKLKEYENYYDSHMTCGSAKRFKKNMSLVEMATHMDRCYNFPVLIRDLVDNKILNKEPSNLEILLAQEVASTKLTLNSKEILADKAEQLCDDFSENPKLKNIDVYNKKDSALKLACDVTGCALNIKAKKKYLVEARKTIGVKQIMDPRDRIESMVNLLASNHPLIADRKEEIKSKAKEALTDYAKKANFNGNPYALATGSIYRTTLLNNIPLTQKEIERCVGITELTIAKNYQKINDTLKLTE